MRVASIALRNGRAKGNKGLMPREGSAGTGDTHLPGKGGHYLRLSTGKTHAGDPAGTEVRPSRHTRTVKDSTLPSVTERVDKVVTDTEEPSDITSHVNGHFQNTLPSNNTCSFHVDTNVHRDRLDPRTQTLSNRK